MHAATGEIDDTAVASLSESPAISNEHATNLQSLAKNDTQDDESTPAVRINNTVRGENDNFGSDGVATSGDTAYVMEGSDRLVAVDPSGETQWVADLPGSSTSPPTVADGRVYVTVSEFAAGELVAYDAVDGTELWSTSDAGVSLSSGTPAVVGEHVYVYEFTSPRTLHAFDPEDGSLIWSEGVSDDLFTFDADDETVYYVTDDVVGALNGSTGDLEWEIDDVLTGDVVAGPTVQDSLLYVSVESGWVDGINNPPSLLAIDVEDGTLHWRTQFEGDSDLEPVFVDGTAFVANDQSLYAIDPDTGVVLAQSLASEEIKDIAVDGDELIVPTADGLLRSLDTDFSVNWTLDVPPDTGDMSDVGWADAVAPVGETTFVVARTHWELGNTNADYVMYTTEPTSIAVSAVEVSTVEAEPGDIITAEATVTNVGDVTDTSSIVFEVYGPLSPIQPEEHVSNVTLDPGEDRTIDISFEVTSTGEYEITTLEAGTGELLPDPRPESAVVSVSHPDPNHDWGHEHFDAAGANNNPYTNAPGGPLQEVWTLEFDGGMNPPLVGDGFVIVHNETAIQSIDLETGEVKWEYAPEVADEDGQDQLSIERHVVVDGVVYFTTEHYTGDLALGDETYHVRLYALDVETGTAVWENDYSTFPENYRLNGNFLLVDEEGVLLELREYFRESPDVPMIDGDTLLSIDRDTGNLHESTPTLDAPIQHGVSTDDHIVFEANRTLYSLERDSLNDVSSRSLNTYTAELASNGEDVFVATRYYHGGDNPTPSELRDVGDIYALNPANLSDERWHAAPDTIYTEIGEYDRHYDLVVTDETLVSAAYYPDPLTVHYAFDLETGELMWEQRYDSPGREKRDLTAGDGVLYAPHTGLSPYTSTLDLATGEPVAESSLAGRYHTTVSNGTVLITDTGGVSALRESRAPEVVDLSLSKTEVRQGDTIEVDVTVHNPADVVVNVALELDWGEPVDDVTDDFELQPGETQTLNYEFDAWFGDNSAYVVVENSGLRDHVRTTSMYVPYTGQRNPLATFEFAPAEPVAGQSITFDAGESNPRHGDVEEYRWDFTGDGTIDTTTANVETTWTFEEPGMHPVTLVIVDESGFQGFQTIPVDVQGEVVPIERTALENARDAFDELADAYDSTAAEALVAEVDAGLDEGAYEDESEYASLLEDVYPHTEAVIDDLEGHVSTASFGAYGDAVSSLETALEEDADAETLALELDALNDAAAELEGWYFAVELQAVDTEVVVGETLTLPYEVTNTGIESGTQQVDLLVNGSTVATETHTVDASTSLEGEFTYETTQADAPSIEVVVQSPDDTDVTFVAIEEQEETLDPVAKTALENASTSFEGVSEEFDSPAAGTIVEEFDQALEGEIYDDNGDFALFIDNVTSLLEEVSDEIDGQVTDSSLADYDEAVTELHDLVESQSSPEALAAGLDAVSESADALEPSSSPGPGDDESGDDEDDSDEDDADEDDSDEDDSDEDDSDEDDADEDDSDEGDADEDDSDEGDADEDDSDEDDVDEGDADEDDSDGDDADEVESDEDDVDENGSDEDDADDDDGDDDDAVEGESDEDDEMATSDDDDGGSSDSLPGFGFITAVLALLAAGMLGLRKRA
ncbi:PQQ-binding-like beta-propeller repeat protein [Natronosalvus amylolyticus]|uniref:outer membrane protein assembly factor BamB family protein n=1 Tax=Natronosalvus amylolyticus TaxID=2961994 RepID=UPI0020C9A78A|nr:PQQ-binding-like beta-propeller repeat protein [Natronosalvus amylolyticus]